MKEGKNGELWFSTDNGLSVFDGNKFKNYNLEEGVSDPDIFLITKDEKGKMWFVSYSGMVFYYHEETDLINPFQEESIYRAENESEFGNIISIVAHDDTVWVGIDRGLLIKLYDTDKIEIDSTNLITNINNGYYFIEIIDGSYCWGTFIKNLLDKDLTVLIKTKKKAIQFYLTTDGLFDFLSGVAFTTLSDNSFVFNYREQLIIVSPNGEYRSVKMPGDFYIIRLRESHDGKIWAGTKENGVFVLDPKNNYQVTHQFLENFSVSEFLYDREGGLWVSTMESGVFYQPLSEFYQWELSDKHDVFRSFSVHEDELYIGTERGELLKLDTTRNKSIEEEFIKVKSGIGVINEVFSGDSILFISSFKNVYQYSKKANNWESYEAGITSKIIRKQVEQFYSMNNSLFLLDPENLKYKQLYHTVCRSMDMELDYDSIVWVSCIDGLKRLDLKQDTIQEQKIFSYKSNDVLLLEDKVLVSTSGHGIQVIDKESLTVESIGKEEGLLSEICSALFYDSQGVLWVGTAKGLSTFRKEGNNYTFLKNYTSYDGFLPSEVIKEMLEWKGRLWFLSNKKLRSLSVQQEESYNHVEPAIFLTSTAVISEHGISNNNLQQLSYHQNSIHFSFKGIAFRNARSIQYRYRLIGLSDAYQYTTDQSVSFVSLSAGTYRFEVDCMNSDGLWSTEGGSIQFTIPEPFWETNWFVFLASLLFVLSLSLAIRFRYKRKNRDKEARLSLLESEQKALAAQINPHFLHNILNSAQYFVNKNQADKAADQLAELSELIRKILENTTSSFVTLYEELDILKRYVHLEEDRFEHQFETVFDIDETIDLYKVYIPSMIVQPYVENAIWHGLQNIKQAVGKLLIQVKKEDDCIVWKIEDNGEGRSKVPKKERKSSGTYLTQERLRLIKEKTKLPYSLSIQDLKDVNNEGVGTVVIIKMSMHGIH